MNIRDQAGESHLEVGGVNVKTLANKKKNSVFIKYLPSGHMFELKNPDSLEEDSIFTSGRKNFGFNSISQHQPN